MATRVINKTWKADGVFTNPTSVLLQDETGTFGIKRNDTGASVVASGTAFTNVSTGVYRYPFTEPVANLDYTAVIRVLYHGVANYFQVDLPAAAPAASPTLAVSYASLRREIGRFLGYGRDPDDWDSDADRVTDVEDILQSGLRRIITPPPVPPERYIHEWTFLKPTTSLTTNAPYITGTIVAVDGIVTLTSGTFPSWAAQGSLVVAAGTYPVATRDSGTQLTLEDTTVDIDSGSTYSLGRTVYDMPSDFASIEGPLIYVAGQSLLRAKIDRISEQQLLMALAFEISASYPRRYAIRAKEVDLTGATAYEMLLSPTPDAAYVLYYRYSVAIPALDSATNTTPPGGDAHGELYIEACLAAAEQKLVGMAGLHSQRFMECLIASVSRDLKTNTPDTLGFNRDRSDRPMLDIEDHFWTAPDTTIYTRRSDGATFP